MPHLPPLAAAIVTIAGIVLAVTRLLTASKDFWWIFPEWVQKGAPALLVALGTLPAALEASKSWMDVLVGFVIAVGAWFTASRGDQRPVTSPRMMRRVKSDPSIPGGPLVVLFFCFALTGLHACAGRSVAWPKVLSCAEPLEQPLVDSVLKVLTGTGDVQSELEALTGKYAPGLIECAVQQIVSDLSSAPVAASASHASARGRAFLEKVQQ